MRHIIHYITAFFKKLNWEFLFFALILCVFLTNTLYVSYPDEFVNILGGKFINAGKIPYREFFDHHLPGAWYLSALFQWFSFGSFVVFRIWWALFSFGCLFAVGRFIKKRNKTAYPYFLLFFFIYPLATVYYWTHLFLADSLAFLFFSVLFWILIVETFEKKTNEKLLYILSFVNFVFIFSSLSFIYIAGFFYLWMLYLQVRNKWEWKKVGMLIGISILPFALYGVYLLTTNSWKEFYISNFVYNTKLYIDIPNYTKGRLFNPLKFGLTIIYNFYQTYIPLLVRIKEFNLYFPVDLVLALGTTMLLFFLAFENKIVFVLFFLILSFSAPRSNLMKIGEMDYQSGMFIALGLISACVVFWRYKFVELKGPEFLNTVKKVFTVFLVLYFSFGAIFLIKNTYDKFYLRYTQKMPGIYDVAYTASFLDDVLEKGDFYWIGPYEPHESFFVKKAWSSGKYPSLLPQFREDEYFKGSFLSELEEHPPKIIIYKHEASIFMTPAMEFGAFFVDWMKGKYTSIEEMKPMKIEKSPSSFNFRTDLYIENAHEEEILQKLQERGYITR